MSFLKKFTNKLTAPEAIVQLVLSNYSVPSGTNIEGSLTVSPKEDFDTTEIRCEIQCVERARVIKPVYDATMKMSVPREVEEASVIFAAKPSLSGPTHFTNGEVRKFPITINIPAVGRITESSYYRNVTWTIKGVLAVDGRPDRTSQTAEIQVIPQNAQTVVTQKEVVRTVVMIPCRYCQGLMDQTLTTCPNCGAKRTI